MELKRREQEQLNEERVLGMMMSVIQLVARPANAYPQASDPFGHTPPPHTLPSNQYPPSSGYPYPPYDNCYCDDQDSD